MSPSTAAEIVLPAGVKNGAGVQETGFFRSWGGSWDTPYGQFFLSWYSGVLIAHGERIVSMAASIFNTLHPQRCTLSNHMNSSQSIINAGPPYESRGTAQVRLLSWNVLAQIIPKQMLSQHT